jgi:AcrR family transcriptional regulator
MGRPREHDERTAAALLVAAERIVAEGGPDALSVRGVAGEVGTTTRAVYSLFGSKDGLITALGSHGFDLLRDGLRALPETDDPGADLVAAGLMFRRFATEHPSLFAIAIQAGAPTTDWPRVLPAATEALRVLVERVGRLADAGRLGGRSVSGAAWQFHALCEGLAAVELRGRHPRAEAKRLWEQALAALIAGFAEPVAERPGPGRKGGTASAAGRRPASRRAGQPFAPSSGRPTSQ